MRDFIWTVIILWVVWKIYDAFILVTKSNHKQPFNSQNNQSYQAPPSNNKKEGEVKVDKISEKQKPHFKSSDGEYVDYEDIT